jgi:hypothetical protein
MRKIALVVGLMAVACSGPEGPTGPAGKDGASGSSGSSGANGANGEGGVTAESDGGGGGGGPGTDVTSYASGTRIKARVTTQTTIGSDGSKLTRSSWGGWYDTMRAEPCSEGALSDGKTYCIPAATVAGASSYFTDAACTIAAPPSIFVGGPTTNCDGTMTQPTLPKYVITTDSGACTRRLRPLVSVAMPAALYGKSVAMCVNVTAFVPAGYVYIDTSAAEISPSSFQEMTQTSTTVP